MQSFNLLEWLSKEYGLRPKTNVAEHLIAHWKDDVRGADFPRNDPPSRSALLAYAKLSDWPRIHALLRHLPLTGPMTGLKPDFAAMGRRVKDNLEDLQRDYPSGNTTRPRQKDDIFAKLERLPSAVQPQSRSYLYGYCTKSPIFAEDLALGLAGSTPLAPVEYVMGYFLIQASPNDMKIEKAEAFYQPADACTFETRRGTWASETIGTGPEDFMFHYLFRYDAQQLRPYVGLVAAKKRIGKPICGSGPTYEGTLFILERLDGTQSTQQSAKKGRMCFELYRSFPSDDVTLDAEIEKLKAAIIGNHMSWRAIVDHI